MAGTWRKEPRKLASGTTWRLVRGREEGRVRLNLGHINEAEAERAREAIQKLEDAGNVQGVLALHARDEAAAVLYLVGDPTAAALMPEVARDYGAMPLREYFEAIYSPWRSETKHRGWRSESGHWSRILAELGDTKLRDIDAHVVADYLDAMRAERGPRSGQAAAGNTKRIRRAAVQALLIRAERQRHIERAPDLSRFRLEGSTKTVLERSDPLTLDELICLMDVSEPKHRAMWAVGAGEGLRPSELMRVRWVDVSLDRRTLAVRGDGEGRGKTELATDTIPLTPIAFDELRAWWVRQGQPATGVVFPSGEEGAAYLSESGFKRALATAARKAGIERPVTPYLLRHSFATIAWSLGIEKDTARRVMRHEDEKMLDKVYCRPRPEDLVAKVAAFARPKEEA